MAVKKMQYQNLNHALKLFKVQVLEGIPYAQKNCPEFSSASDIFEWLKLRTKYKNDPQGTELFQTLPTLLENNFHGITGHGDCDCFTIAALTILAANNFKNFGIVLVGRNSFNPVHIYCYVIDETGTKHYLDLTNKYFNQTRNYLYKQEIPFNLTLKEKNDMLLQLADMGAPRRKRKPTPEQLKKYMQTPAYKRKRAAFLKRQAEVQARHEQHVRQGRKMRPNFNHVYLPSKGVQIREDYFDNRLSNGEFQHMLLSEGYELNEIEELAGRRGDRRRQKKEDKHKAKMEKKASKTELRRSKAEKKRAKGEAAKERAAAKRDKYQNRGGGEDGEESEAESTAGRIFGKVIGGAKQVVGVYKSARGGSDDSSGDDSGEESTGAGSPPTVRTRKDENEPKMITIFGKEIKQSTAIIAGVVTAAAVVGTVIAVKNRNKRAAQAA